MSLVMRRTFLILLLGLVALSIASAAAARTGRVAVGPWKAWWGQTSTTGGVYRLASQAPASPAETHCALVTSAGAWGDQTFSYTETTVKQLRRGSAPNTWEVAWSVLHFRDLAT